MIIFQADLFLENIKETTHYQWLGLNCNVSSHYRTIALSCIFDKILNKTFLNMRQDILNSFRFFISQYTQSSFSHSRILTYFLLIS